MAKYQVDIKTTVSGADDYLDVRRIDRQNGPAGLVVKAAVHIMRDPVTNTMECCVFTDDGAGNGVMMFKFDMD